MPQEPSASPVNVDDETVIGSEIPAPAPYAVGNVYIDKGGTYSLSPFAWIAGGIVYVYKHNSNANANAVAHNATTGVSIQLFGTYKV